MDKMLHKDLDSFISNVCFEDVDLAKELFGDFVLNFKRMKSDFFNYNHADAITQLHNLSGSTGLMELDELSKKIKNIELLVEDRHKNDEEFYSLIKELEEIDHDFIQALIDLLHDR